MAFATINGAIVIGGKVTLPRVGRWDAFLAVDADSAEGLVGPVALQLGEALTLHGTAQRSGEYAGFVTMLVVGGASGLYQQLSPKAYRDVPLRIPLANALAEVGERLSDSSDADALAVQLSKWARFAGTCFEEVENLAAQTPGAAWRFLPDGSLWMGMETWPEVELGHTLLEDHRWCAQSTIGLDDTADAARLLPGVSFLGRRVDLVEHKIEADKLRVHLVNVEPPSATGMERLPASEFDRIRLVIERRLRPLRYQATFPAKVVKQNPDGTLELVPDRNTLAPGLSNVPMRAPWPGVTAKVAPGSRVAVVFEEGDPQKQATGHFEPDAGQLLELEVQAQQRASLNAPDVRLGGDASTATEALVKGTSYRAAEAASNAAVQAALTAAAAAHTAGAAAWAAVALVPAVAAVSAASVACGAAGTAETAAAAACTAAAAAVGTMEGSAATFLSLVSKTG